MDLHYRLIMNSMKMVSLKYGPIIQNNLFLLITMVLLNAICVINMKKKQKYYSYSQLNTFYNCPQKYKIIYIDKIQNNNESIEAFAGKRVHETLEWLYSDLENNHFISFDRIADKFNNLWNQKWHDNIYVAKNPYKKNNVDYFI